MVGACSPTSSMRRGCRRADEARARIFKAANRDPRLLEAAAGAGREQVAAADLRLRNHLAAHPTDIAALRMRAEVAARLRRYADAQELLERCLELAPSFDASTPQLAVVLNRQAKPAAALVHVEKDCSPRSRAIPAT
jgi:cytochrome c-type biogenesis protein CcmH/NrfG